MKKVSIAAANQIRNFSGQKLTIGLDLGDRSSWYCMLDEAGSVLLEQRLSTTPEGHASRVWENAAQSDRAGDRNAFSVGEPNTQRVRTRSDRGACAQRALDRGESKER